MTRVKDIMTKETLYCTVLDNVYEAAVKMKDGDVGAIPVVLDDGLELVGIVTAIRDLVLRGIAAKKPNSQKITNVMTTDLITVSEDDSIEKAVDLMGDYQIKGPGYTGKNACRHHYARRCFTHNNSNRQAGDALTFISENEERPGDFLH